MIPELRVQFLNALEPSTNKHLYSKAWDEFIELQVMDKQTWIRNLHDALESVPRWEIGMWLGDTAVGGIVLSNDNDVHVGPCLSVIAQYVLPEYRFRSISLHCMRIAMRTARQCNIPILAYTHRKGDWRYEIIYRRTNVKETKS